MIIDTPIIPSAELLEEWMTDKKCTYRDVLLRAVRWGFGPYGRTSLVRARRARIISASALPPLQILGTTPSASAAHSLAFVH